MADHQARAEFESYFWEVDPLTIPQAVRDAVFEALLRSGQTTEEFKGATTFTDALALTGLEIEVCKLLTSMAEGWKGNQTDECTQASHTGEKSTKWEISQAYISMVHEMRVLGLTEEQILALANGLIGLFDAIGRVWPARYQAARWLASRVTQLEGLSF